MYQTRPVCSFSFLPMIYIPPLLIIPPFCLTFGCPNVLVSAIKSAPHSAQLPSSYGYYFWDGNGIKTFICKHVQAVYNNRSAPFQSRKNETPSKDKSWREGGQSPWRSERRDLVRLPKKIQDINFAPEDHSPCPLSQCPDPEEYIEILCPRKLQIVTTTTVRPLPAPSHFTTMIAQDESGRGGEVMKGILCSARAFAGL